MEIPEKEQLALIEEIRLLVDENRDNIRVLERANKLALAVFHILTDADGDVYSVGLYLQEYTGDSLHAAIGDQEGAVEWAEEHGRQLDESIKLKYFMDYDLLFKEIDHLSEDQARAEIIIFLKKQLVILAGSLEQSIDAAYSIAGLMATDYARSLENNDPVSEILTIAGELEIHPDNAEELRDELVSKIKALP